MYKIGGVMGKKGVSLVSLLITIIVVVILASVVISSADDTGIIEKSQISGILTKKDKYSGELKMYLNDAKVKTFSNYSNKQLLIGEIDDKYKIVSNNTVYETIINENVSVEVYEIDETLFEEKFGEKLELDIEGGNWYVSPSYETIYYIYTDKSSIPEWILENQKINDKLSDFVLDNLTEK